MGWNYNIQIYDVLPNSSPIFQMIYDGSIEGVQHLFSTGEASPFIRNSDGYTLLDVRDSLTTKFRLNVKLILRRRQQGMEIWKFADY
jgi:hypothetical protein